ncbi:MAG: hypothetical protein ACYS9X_07575 [Planctomycetota bacterium]
MFPQHWKTFIDQHSLVGIEIEVPEERDLSGLGIELQFLDEQGCKREADELYPGITVKEDGFIPVGTCMSGSGDPYFINTNDGEGGPLYRIYHDSVSEDGYDRQEAVVVVLQDYRDVLGYVGT